MHKGIEQAEESAVTTWEWKEQKWMLVDCGLCLWTRNADLVWTWRRTTLTRACNHGEWRAALSPGWSSCATRRKSVKMMNVCLYTVLYFARVSLLPYPWTRWTLRSSTTSTHEPSGLDSSNRRKQVRRGGRDCKITISLACQINIAKLSSCIHFFSLSAYPTSMESCLVPLKVGCADGYAALPMPLFLHSYT